MGDFADEAIDRGLEDVMHYDNYRDTPDHIKHEQGLLDEFGFEYQPDMRLPIDPFRRRK